ncbi:MAG: ABC transporter permease, partial [Chloroflexi bacterium]
MRPALNIMRLQLMIFFAQRGNLIGLIVIPVAFTIAIGFAGGGFGDSEDDAILIDVIDRDESALSAQFLTDLREANPRFVLCPFDNDADDICDLGDTALDETTATERLKDETALAFIEIPADFEAHVQAAIPVNIIYRANENISAPSFILQAVQTVTQRMSATLVAATAGTDAASKFPGVAFADENDRAAFAEAIRTRAAAIWAETPITIDFVLTDVDETDESTTIGFGQSVPGMGTMFVMFTVFAGVFGIVQQRQQWTLQRLVTMPVSNAHILGGLILAFFVLGMIQYAVVFLVG